MIHSDSLSTNDTWQQLINAEEKSKELFNAVELNGLIAAGKTEMELSNEITELASRFGITEFWHKKIVRTGANTLESFSGNPANRVIEDDDILFIDLGPIYNGWEADIGRTYVLGNDPLKKMLRRDVEIAWYEARKWYSEQTDLTGAQFFQYLIKLSKRYGWEFGGEIGGHLIGKFPHEQPDDPKDLCFDIHPDNHADILQWDKDGNARHWILELQFVDRKKNIGAYFEQILC